MAFTVEMDDPGLVVLPTHRILQNLEQFDENAAVDALKENFSVEKYCPMTLQKMLKRRFLNTLTILHLRSTQEKIISIF